MRRYRSGWWLLGLLCAVLGGGWLVGPPSLPLPVDSARTSSPAEGIGAFELDPFNATPAELCLLPGIGPQLARRLHRGIHRNGLTRFDQLQAIHGIGPARVQAIRMAVRSWKGH